MLWVRASTYDEILGYFKENFLTKHINSYRTVLNEDDKEFNFLKGIITDSEQENYWHRRQNDLE